MKWKKISILGVVVTAGAFAVPAEANSTGPSKMRAQSTYYTGTYALPSGRQYMLHTTQEAHDYQGLVIALPGLYNTASTMQSQTGLTTWVEDPAHQYVLVYGIGIGNAWNAGACCGTADDVQYIRDIIDQVPSFTQVDLTKVYVVGFSNGAMMAYRAACEIDTIRAALVVAGSMLAPCTRQLSVLHVHNPTDTTVPLSGTSTYAPLTGINFPSAWTEPLRMPRNSTWSFLPWYNSTVNAHYWPGWSMDRFQYFINHLEDY